MARIKNCKSDRWKYHVERLQVALDNGNERKAAYHQRRVKEFTVTNSIKYILGENQTPAGD